MVSHNRFNGLAEAWTKHHDPETVKTVHAIFAHIHPDESGC